MNKIFLSLMLTFSLLAVGCRKDQPPPISIICTIDDFGGGKCVLSDGTRVYKMPSEMAGMWATTQTDQANFASWCYKVPFKTAEAGMAEIKDKIDGVKEARR